jgi:hypothetical protein
MRKPKTKIAASLALAAALLLYSCAGRTPDGSGVGGGAPDSGHIYLESELELGVAPAEDIEFAVAGGKLYFTAREDLFGEDGEGRFMIGQRAAIYSAETDGSGARELARHESVSEGRDMARDVIAYSSQRGFAADDGGNVFVLTENVVIDNPGRIYEHSTELVKYGADDGELFRADISEDLDATAVSARDIVCGADGNVYLTDGMGCAAFSGETGELIFAETWGGASAYAYVSNAARMPDGSVVFLSRRDGAEKSHSVKRLDAKAGTTETLGEYASGGHIGYLGMIFNGSGEYGLYFQSGNSLYGLRLDNMTEDVIINLSGSDLKPTNYAAFAPLGGGEFAALRIKDGKSALVRLSPADESVPRETVTLGAYNPSPALSEAVAKFNRGRDDARITIVDYGGDSADWEEQILRFDMDVVAGRVPDMMDLSRLEAGKYSSKGIFEDLGAYIDGDGGVRREDLYENILSLTTSGTGELHSVAVSFHVASFAGKRSIFGERDAITLRELREAAERYPGAVLMPEMDALTWILYAVVFDAESYVDWETGECRFDGAEFVELLKFAATLPDTPPEEDYSPADYDGIYLTDRALLMPVNISEPGDIDEARKRLGGEPAFVGCPVDTGSGNIAVPDIRLAVNEKSEHRELCLEFIGAFLRGEFEVSGISVNKAAAGDAGADAERLRSVVEGVTRMQSGYGGGTLMNIVEEEAEAFLAGARPAEETAAIIQSRARLYVGESM